MIVKNSLQIIMSGIDQVVVRAGTSLGNILLNVLITEGTHIEKQGKNNIMVRQISLINQSTLVLKIQDNGTR